MGKTCRAEQISKIGAVPARLLLVPVLDGWKGKSMYKSGCSRRALTPLDHPHTHPRRVIHFLVRLSWQCTHDETMLLPPLSRPLVRSPIRLSPLCMSPLLSEPPTRRATFCKKEINPETRLLLRHTGHIGAPRCIHHLSPVPHWNTLSLRNQARTIVSP